jgi:hypothetical protein
MKCPGCREEIDEGTEYCDFCGGRIIESGIDYSQRPWSTSGARATATSEQSESDHVQRLEERFENIRWGRFIGALIGTPFAAFLLVMSGLENGNTYHLIAGIVFACLSIVLTIRYIKAYGGRTDQESEDSMMSSPRSIDESEPATVRMRRNRRTPYHSSLSLERQCGSGVRGYLRG